MGARSRWASRAAALNWYSVCLAVNFIMLRAFMLMSFLVCFSGFAHDGAAASTAGARGMGAAEVVGSAAAEVAGPAAAVGAAAPGCGEARACNYCLPGLSLDTGVGQQVCRGGEWQLACEAVRRAEVTLSGDDSRLRHAAGEAVAGRGWLVPAGTRAGTVVQSGPGQALPEGQYRVEFRGRAARPGAAARLSFEVWDATLGRTLAQAARVEVQQDFAQALTFRSPASCHGLELRVRYDGGGPVQLLATRLVPVDSVEVAQK